MSLVLIVDDEPDIRELLEITLTRMGVSALSAEDLATAQQTLQEQHFDLVLTDMHLPDGSGIDLIRTIQERWPQTPVAVITAYGSMETAITALKAGAYDFISKPVDLTRLRELVQHALRLSSKTPVSADGDPLIGNSEAMQRLRLTLQKLARSQAPVCIHGESGSGKELVARRIHELSSRSEHPFIPVNCGAIPVELMETEFFGHKKGSFTGAQEDKIGLFQAAGGGTLFLDEVADLPLSMQVKLLRAIQEKTIRPVGATREMAIDVRIISASHKDLQLEVEAGRFRQDLFYRLHVIPLRVPALRERREDIPTLAQHFLRRSAETSGMPGRELSTDALTALQAYDWPGNVRQLRNLMDWVLIMAPGGTADPIRAEMLPPEVGSSAPALFNADPSADIMALPLREARDLFETQYLQAQLLRFGGNISRTAGFVGMERSALHRKLKQLGIGAEDRGG